MLTLFRDSKGPILEHYVRWGRTGNRVHCGRMLWGWNSNTFQMLSLARPHDICFEFLKYGRGSVIQTVS